MRPLSEIASLIRSKNAGPFVMTFDIMLASQADYDRVLASGQLSAEHFAALYGCSADAVRFFECPNALAFKFSIARPITQGDIGDADMHGGQHYAPLMSIMIP